MDVGRKVEVQIRLDESEADKLIDILQNVAYPDSVSQQNVDRIFAEKFSRELMATLHPETDA